VCMQPDSSELLRLSAKVDLSVKEIADRTIIELDTDARHLLFDDDEIHYREQVVRVRDAEATDFTGRLVSEVQEFGPRRGAEP